MPEHYSAKTIEEAGLVAPAIRVIVESTCADLAARRAGTQGLRTLEAELQKYRDALASRDPEGTVAADGRFHLALARAAGNEVFCDILQALDPVATTNRRRALDIYNDRRLLGLHEDILEVVRRRDPQAARRAMQRPMRAIQNVETLLARGESPEETR